MTLLLPPFAFLYFIGVSLRRLSEEEMIRELRLRQLRIQMHPWLDWGERVLDERLRFALQVYAVGRAAKGDDPHDTQPEPPPTGHWPWTVLTPSEAHEAREALRWACESEGRWSELVDAARWVCGIPGRWQAPPGRIPPGSVGSQWATVVLKGEAPHQRGLWVLRQLAGEWIQTRPERARWVNSLSRMRGLETDLAMDPERPTHARLAKRLRWLESKAGRNHRPVHPGWTTLPDDYGHIAPNGGYWDRNERGLWLRVETPKEALRINHKAPWLKWRHEALERRLWIGEQRRRFGPATLPFDAS